MIFINKSNLNTIKRYYLPLWILRNPKTGTSKFIVNLFKFVKPIKNKFYIKKFGITYNLETTNMSILNAESNTGIQLTLTKPEIEDLKNYIHNNPIFRTKINRTLRIKKLFYLILASDYQLAHEFLDLVLTGIFFSKSDSRRSNHLVRILNRHYYYLKPQNIDTLIDYQKIKANAFDTLCIDSLKRNETFLSNKSLHDPTYQKLDDEETHAMKTDGNQQFLDKVKMLKPLLHN